MQESIDGVLVALWNMSENRGGSLPEIEGLGVNVGLREKGSDVVQAPLHHSQMQSWEEADTSFSLNLQLGKQRSTAGRSAGALTVVSILVLGGEVYPVLQQHGADGGQVLLGGQVQRCLPVFGQLIYFGSGQQLEAETHHANMCRASHLFQNK